MRPVILYLFLLTVTALQAQSSFPKQTGWTNDFENDLDLGTVVGLNKLIEAHKTKTGNQIVVVTTPNAAPYSNFYDYVEEITKAWEIGGKDKKTGVTIVFSLEKTEVKIYVGTGLKAKLNGEACQKIINEKMLPKFTEGNVDQALIDGVTEIIKILEKV